MATVLLGNTAPVQAPLGTSVAVNGEVVDAPEPVESTLPSRTIVLIVTPDDAPLDKQLSEVRSAFALHSSGSPAWVEAHNDFFAQAVAQTFGCPVGRPDDWDAPVSAQEPVSAPAPVEAAQVVDHVDVEAQEA